MKRFLVRASKETSTRITAYNHKAAAPVESAPECLICKRVCFSILFRRHSYELDVRKLSHQGVCLRAKIRNRLA
jgi:hypothetical protein